MLGRVLDGLQLTCWGVGLDIFLEMGVNRPRMSGTWG